MIYFRYCSNRLHPVTIRLRQMDRRASRRMDVQLRCYARVPGGRARQLTGTTQNMSRSGIFIRWNASAVWLPPAGQLLTVEIELPANQVFGRKCMQCQATVVRVGGEAEAAVMIDQVKFRNDIGGVLEMRLAEQPKHLVM